MFLVGCQQLQVGEAPKEEPAAAQIQEEQEEQKPLPVLGCEDNSNCEQGLWCIDKQCKTLASLYNTDCEDKCSITAVKVKTSDGEEYDLSLGQGSYTAAGALEWKLLKTPDYCPGEEPLVAVNLIKKTTGKILAEEVITLHQGESSEVITHPTVKSVQFTATLEEVTESCS